MFGRKRKERDLFEERLSETKFKLVYVTLKEIAKFETVVRENNGQKVQDLAATIQLMKSRAQSTITFVDKLEEDDD